MCMCTEQHWVSPHMGRDEGMKALRYMLEHKKNIYIMEIILYISIKIPKNTIN